jgi:hypothetical protein
MRSEREGEDARSGKVNSWQGAQVEVEVAVRASRSEAEGARFGVSGRSPDRDKTEVSE